MQSFKLFLESFRADKKSFTDFGKVRIYGSKNPDTRFGEPTIIPPEKLLTTPSTDGYIRFISFMNGKVSIGDFDYHANFPEYSNSNIVIHGYIMPEIKELGISTASGIPLRDLFKNTCTYVCPALKTLVNEKIINNNWIFDSGYVRTTVGEFLSQNNQITNKEAEKSADKLLKDRETEGKNLIRQYRYKLHKSGTKDPDYFYPKENFSKFIESVEGFYLRRRENPYF